MEDQGFPGGSAGKEFTCNAGDPGSIPGLGRSPGGGHGNPLQYSCLENPHGQRSLASYSPWGRKESDTTEQLSTHIYHAHNTAISPYFIKGFLTLIRKSNLYFSSFGLHCHMLVLIPCKLYNKIWEFSFFSCAPE